MCFYEQFLYQCSDWKWGNFRQHCQAEYRTGETCGSKFVFQTFGLQEKCKLCLKIDAKERRKAKHIDDYNRWRREPRRYSASIEKALGDIKSLENEIGQLKAEKADRSRAFGARR
ncbi:hypothetical protein WHR41_05329 [Cladosporium halotolerans]|uniref:Uncharacterized protein n=1 Tax=Cladosporium halotolerans TaxID=1052096 RepID=A0AB34KS19_9PEZI